MSNVAIVAIPSQDDYVHKISSEKIAHMTILFLGETSKVKNLAKILDFVQHSANRTLTRFGMDVDRRGELGQDKADVLFFSKNKWSGFETINSFRSNLLKNDNIRNAYDSIEQYAEWVPHLTLGFPDTPAKPDPREYPGINYVNFDRIAVWFGEYEGIEFPLKAHDWDTEMAMSNGSEAVDNILAHFGVKGMKWGVRRDRSPAVSVQDKRKRLKTKGGHGLPADPSAVRARVIGQKAKASGLKALTDQELKEYANRLNLEQNVKRLQYQDSPPVKRFVLKQLGQTGQESVKAASNEVVTQRVRRVFVKV